MQDDQPTEPLPRRTESPNPGTRRFLRSWGVAERPSFVLVLRLRRIEMMGPGDILYSLPSICDAIPGLNDQPVSGNEFILAEDDWRQFELVSNKLAHEVDEEIGKIRLIHENSADEAGWREIHVRSKPEIPLDCNLGLTDLASALNVSAEPRGVAYRGASSQVADGYAFQANDFTVYGVVLNGNTRTIAFDQYSEKGPSAELIGRLKSVAHELDLDLVYWCRCARVDPARSPRFSPVPASGSRNENRSAWRAGGSTCWSPPSPTRISQFRHLRFLAILGVLVLLAYEASVRRRRVSLTAACESKRRFGRGLLRFVQKFGPDARCCGESVPRSP